MQREIKFRAWDENNKVMLMPECCGLFIHLDGELNSFDSEGELVGTEFTRQLRLMQYTGLKDKNDKEIYEGDIVRALKHNEDLFTDKVWWRSGILWFGNWNWIEFQNIFRVIEVIGNIFEDGELLANRDI